MNKAYILLRHKDFDKVSQLIGIRGRVIPEKDLKAIHKILKAAIYSEKNPIKEDQAVNGIVWDGNILLDMP